GSSMFWDKDGRGFLAIAAGALDQPTGLATVGHIFTADRGDYYEITDGLEQNPGSMLADGTGA
ncbi:MAG: GFA family protein, partial [Alphaproteobacteria bacterium]